MLELNRFVQLTSSLLTARQSRMQVSFIFSDCKNLTLLSLDRTAVTDVGLSHLSRCINLESLSLKHTAVTDAGLAYFKQIAESLGNSI